MSFSKNRQIYSFLCAHVHWNEGVLAPPTHIPCLSLAQKNKNQRKCLFFSHFFKKTIDNSACLCYDIQARKGKTTKYAPVAQQVEHLTFNQRVWSSNLHRSTKKSSFFGTRIFYPSRRRGSPKRACRALGVLVGLAWNHASACMESRLRRVWHQPIGCIYRSCGLMRYSPESEIYSFSDG